MRQRVGCAVILDDVVFDLDVAGRRLGAVAVPQRHRAQIIVGEGVALDHGAVKPHLSEPVSHLGERVATNQGIAQNSIESVSVVSGRGSTAFKVWDVAVEEVVFDHNAAWVAISVPHKRP